MIKYFFYSILTSAYSKIFTFFEKILYKKKIISNQFLDKGFELVKINKIINYDEIKTNKLNSNRFMNKDILSYDDIIKIINEIFLKGNLAKLISNKTGFNYSIDFFISYETLPLPEDQKSKQWYANHWHKDRPFSSNALKVIIPIVNPIGENDGGIEILDRQKSKLKRNLTSFYKMKAFTDEALLFLPNLCLHRAGNPELRPRKQIMFQLNPSKTWKVNVNIYKKQKNIEPKFPFFSYFFDNYISLVEEYNNK